MSRPQSKAAVKRVEAPLVQPEIQFELTKRSAYGLASAGVAIALLIFVSGVVIGVSINLDSAASDAAAAIDDEAGAAEQSILAMQTGPAAPLDSTVLRGSALPLTGLDSPEPAADLPRPELGSVLTAPDPAPARSSAASPAPVPPSSARPATPAQARAGSGGTFHLQAGAFRAPENAENLKARLTERGYTARVRVTEGSAGQPLFRVLLGEYPTEATARSAADDFQSDTGQEAYVMTSRELGA